MRRLTLLIPLVFACNPQKPEKRPAPAPASAPAPTSAASAPAPSKSEAPKSLLRFTTTAVGSLHSQSHWTPERVAAALPGYTLNIKRDKTPDGYPYEEWRLMQGETMIAELLPFNERLLSAAVHSGEVEGARVQPGGSFDGLLSPSLTCQRTGRSDSVVGCADDVPPEPAFVGASKLSYWVLPPKGTNIPEGRFAPELLKGTKVAWVDLAFDGKSFPAIPTEAAAKDTWAEDLVMWESLDKLWLSMTPEEIDALMERDNFTESAEELAGLACKKLESSQGYRVWIAEAGPMAGKVVAVEGWLLDGEEEHVLSMRTNREVTLGATLSEVEKLYADLGAARVGNEVRVGAGNHWLSFRAKEGEKVDRLFLGRATPEWLGKR